LSKYNYPKEITKDNIEQSKERAKLIKRKTSISVFLTSFFYGLIAILLIYSSPFFINFLIQSVPQISQEVAIATVLVVFVLIIQFTVLFLFDFIEFLINKVLKLDYRESVLASCVLISSYLFTSERKKATKEVDSFVVSILGLKRTTGRAYSKEINLVSKGTSQIRRMFSFSEENIGELLLRFGTSLYYNDDPMAFLFLSKFIDETQKYGKIEGLLKRLESIVKSYKGIIALILSVATIVATLWSRGIIG
jgi:hypothetical protein